MGNMKAGLYKTITLTEEFWNYSRPFTVMYIVDGLKLSVDKPYASVNIRVECSKEYAPSIIQAVLEKINTELVQMNISYLPAGSDITIYYLPTE